MIEYSAAAKVVKSKFFSYRNDLDIYTEDKLEDNEFYVTLFRRLVNGVLKINDVFPIGCKSDVTKAFETYKKSNDVSRKKLFIVDGDLDLISGTNLPSGDGFHVLNAYCIENFIIDSISSIKLVYYNLGSQSKENCEKQLGFEDWLQYNCSSLIELFLHLALLKEISLGSDLKHATQFLKQSNKETILDHTKVNNYIHYLKEKLFEEAFPFLNDVNAYYTRRIAELRILWPDNISTLLTIVSGKDYLLPLLQFRINKIVNKISLIPKQTIKLFLADNCDLARLRDLQDLLLN